MRIAVDARYLQTDVVPNHKKFTKEVILSLARHYGEHQFIFFTESPTDPLINFPKNVIPVLITPKPTNLLLYKWWYDVKIFLALKKHNADVFIGTNGICSATTKVPQVLIVQDLAFRHYSGFFHKYSLFFRKRFMPRFLRKAAAIITFSDFIKQEIITSYAIPEQKITVIGTVSDTSFKPLQWEEREKVKDKYAQGCEYFIFTGGLNPEKNLINLLKAFSLFKKRQKTNMKLVIAGDIGKYKDEAEKLNLYKYKNDINLTGDLSISELADVTAAAYTMLFPSTCKGFGMAVLEAMQCQVPVITTINSSMSEIAGDAALYADPNKPEEIAEQMKRVFKDEQVRNTLIAAGKERVKVYNWDKTTSLTWQAVEKAVCR